MYLWVVFLCWLNGQHSKNLLLPYPNILLWVTSGTENFILKVPPEETIVSPFVTEWFVVTISVVVEILCTEELKVSWKSRKKLAFIYDAWAFVLGVNDQGQVISCWPQVSHRVISKTTWPGFRYWGNPIVRLINVVSGVLSSCMHFLKKRINCQRFILFLCDSWSHKNFWSYISRTMSNCTLTFMLWKSSNCSLQWWASLLGDSDLQEQIQDWILWISTYNYKNLDLLYSHNWVHHQIFIYLIDFSFF